MVEVTDVMPVRREYLNGLARFQEQSAFPCPICGGRAVRALSDTHGRADVGDFYCLDHREPFRALLMQSDKGGTLNKDQEIIALEIEKQLREKQESRVAASTFRSASGPSGSRCQKETSSGSSQSLSTPGK